MTALKIKVKKAKMVRKIEGAKVIADAATHDCHLNAQDYDFC